MKKILSTIIMLYGNGLRQEPTELHAAWQRPPRINGCFVPATQFTGSSGNSVARSRRHEIEFLAILRDLQAAIVEGVDLWRDGDFETLGLDGASGRESRLSRAKYGRCGLNSLRELALEGEKADVCGRRPFV